MTDEGTSGGESGGLVKKLQGGMIRVFLLCIESGSLAVSLK